MMDEGTRSAAEIREDIKRLQGDRDRYPKGSVDYERLDRTIKILTGYTEVGLL
jgi:hypothetical protein